MTILYVDRSEANGSVMLRCSECRCELDRLYASEFTEYYHYVLRTADYPFCEHCDPGAGDMVHPAAEEVAQVLRLSCLLPNHARD